MANQEYLIPYQVFISYAKEDKERAIDFYNSLSKEGIQAWIDTMHLNPGENWEYTIKDAIKQIPYIIVLLSKNSVAKKGFIQKEIKEALDIADTLPENGVYILPVRLEECEVPQRLQKWQWTDYYNSADKQKLIYFIKAKLGISNIPLFKEHERELRYFLTDELIADTMLFRLFTGSFRVLRSKSQSPLLYLSDGYCMDIRKRNTKFIKLFDEVFPRCQKVDESKFTSIIPAASNYRIDDNLLKKVEVSKFMGPPTFILESQSGIKCRLKQTYLSYILEKYSDSKVYIQNATKPIIVEQNTKVVFMAVPHNY